jgi:hypothetical protein
MKTAILLSGAMRTFDQCLKTQQWHVYRHFKNPDFFVSTVEDADAHKAQLLNFIPHGRVEIEAVKEQPDCVTEMREKCGEDVLPKQWGGPGIPYTFEPYAISVHPQAVLRQLWQLEKCWEFFTSKATATEYDVIIRVRPDLWFHSVERFRARPETGSSKNVAYVPNWGRFGGVNDRFAILGQAAAYAYFNTYSKIPELTKAGCPIHPESLVAASLEFANVGIQPLQVEFSTLRPPANGAKFGEMRRPEITEVDLLRARA